MARSPIQTDDMSASGVASRHQPMNWRDSIGFQTSVTQKAFPKCEAHSVSFPIQRTRVTQVTQDVLNKKITCILYDLSYFGKIINILQILQGVCKLLTSIVSLEIKVSDSDLKSATVAKRQYDTWTLFYIPNRPELIFSAVASVWLYVNTVKFPTVSMLYLQPYSHEASVCARV